MSTRAVVSHFSRLFEYTWWADQRILASLDDQRPPPPGVLSLFAHVLAAEKVWLMRLRGQDSFLEPIWPELSARECSVLAARNVAGYSSFLEAAPAELLQRSVHYRNQSGAEYLTRVQDILTHVTVHGAYHRGQIATAVRAAGGTPVNTDFITFVREGG